jgi:hypothetical protein
MTSLARATLAAHTAAATLDDLGFAGLERLCRQSAARHAPERALGTDPRGELPVAYSEARAGRLGAPGCVVCAGETCPAADIAPLPADDLAWLTPNYYPVAYPFPDGRDSAQAAQDVKGVQDVQSPTAAAPRRPMMRFCTGSCAKAFRVATCCGTSTISSMPSMTI